MEWLFGGTAQTFKRLKIVLVIFHLMNFLFIFTMDKSMKKHFIFLEILLVILTGMIYYYVPRDQKEKIN